MIPCGDVPYYCGVAARYTNNQSFLYVLSTLLARAASVFVCWVRIRNYPVLQHQFQIVILRTT